MRFLTPVQFTKPRYVRRDVELDGIRLRKGDKVMAMLAAANMDPSANPIRSGSTCNAGRTAISLSAPAFISALAISSRASKPDVR